MDADSITVVFDATFDELVDVHLRGVHRSGLARRWRRQSIVTAGVVSGVAASAVLYGESRSAWVLLGGLAAGICTSLLSRPWLEHSSTQRMRRLVAEHFGDDGPTHCEMTIDPTGFCVSQRGTETTYPWDQAAVVEEPTGDLELRFRNNIVVVRARAFSNPAQRSRFVERVQALARP